MNNFFHRSLDTPPYIDAHTHHGASSEACICFHTYRHGIHPWLVKHPLSDIQCKELRLNPPPYFGEVGIDRSKDIDPKIQQQIFSQYLNLAKELQVPIVVHAVKAYQDILQALKSTPYHRVMIHGFRGNRQTAIELLKHQCYLSLGSALLSDQKLKETLKDIPLSQLFFETDDQIEVSIELIYQQAASILNLSLDDLKKQIYANALSFFGDPDDWKKMD